MFGYMSGTHLCGPMVSANNVGGSPSSSHACDDTSVPWRVLHICMSVMWLGHVAACLCSSRLAKCGCVMGIGAQLQFCQFGDSGFVQC